jgi:predicted ABC-type ATPase
LTRVAHGGHDIPETVIERRFSRSLRNLLNEFGKRVHGCFCYMNDQGCPVLVYEQHGDTRIIERDEYY